MISFAKSTFIITVFSMMGLGLTFLSNMVIASRFGAGAEMDVYLAATTFPTLVIAILTGALSSTFLPVFAEYREKDPAEGWRVVSTFLNLATLFSLFLCSLTAAFANPLMELMAPGFAPERIAESADLLRWLLPAILLTVINELISGVYFSNGKFLAPMLIKVLGPALTILYVLAFASTLSMRSLVFATLTAGSVQTAVLVFGLLKDRDFRFSLVLDTGHPAVRRILSLMVPLMLGMSLSKVLPGFERWLASELPIGSISHLGYATRLSTVLQAVIVSGISISGFALMANFASKRDFVGVKSVMEKSMSFMLFVSVPLAAILPAFGAFFVALLFQRGAFTPADTLATSMVFSIHILSLPAMALGTVLGQSFYIFQDTRTPAVLALLETALYVFLCRLLIPHVGLLAIPISFNIYFYLSILMLGLLLSRKTGYSVLALALRPFLLALLASLPGLLLGIAAIQVFPRSGLLNATAMAAAFGIYFLVQKGIFRNREADMVLNIIMRKTSLDSLLARFRKPADRTHGIENVEEPSKEK